jgi:hypothetical protein
MISQILPLSDNSNFVGDICNFEIWKYLRILEINVIIYDWPFIAAIEPSEPADAN